MYGYFHTVISDTIVTIATLHYSMKNYEYALSNLQEALFISSSISDHYAPSYAIITMLNEINSKIEHSKNSAGLDNNSYIQLNDVQRIFNRLYPYTIKDVEKDGNCFFRATVLSLEFPQSMHCLLRDETVSYIRHNLNSFYEFSENIHIEIDYLSQEGGWADNLSIQAFADAFQVNIRLYNTHGDNFATITSRTSNQDRTIRLLYSLNHYMPILDSTINDDPAIPAEPYRLCNLPSSENDLHTVLNEESRFSEMSEISAGIASDDSNYLNQEYNYTHITYITDLAQEEQFDPEIGNIFLNFESFLP